MFRNILIMIFTFFIVLFLITINCKINLKKINIEEVKSIKVIDIYNNNEIEIFDKKIIYFLLGKNLLKAYWEPKVFLSKYKIIFDCNGEEMFFLVSGNNIKFERKTYIIPNNIDEYLKKLFE